MIKLFERIFWHNNTTPAINEDNLNAMSKAIDDIDNRVIDLGADVMEVVPQIQAYLDQAADLVEAMELLTKNPPYIGANGNWYVWDTETSSFVDSGIDASITVQIADVTMLNYGTAPYITNTGTNTDPIFHLFIPRAAGITSITKTGTSGLVDTYTVTFQDGNTSTFQVTNGKGIVSIAKTSTSGLVDTYTITFNDSTTTTFTVTNGNGDMNKSTYDPQNAVENAGGIPNYVSGAVSSLKSAFTNNVNVNGSKNLIGNKNGVVTNNGITFTPNKDGSITINGTASNNATYNFNIVGDTGDFPTKLKVGEQYVITTGLVTATDIWLRLSMAGDLYRYNGTTNANAQTKNTFTHTAQANSDYVNGQIRVTNGAVISNVTIYPMLCLKTDYDADNTYVPYSKTNLQLTQDSVTWTDEAQIGAVNLFNNTSASQVLNGVTYTVNSDKSVTASTGSGGATGLASVPVISGAKIPQLENDKTYRISGCPDGGSINKYECFVYDTTASAYVAHDFGDGAVFTYNSSHNYNVGYCVRQGTVLTTPITFYPMITPVSYNGPYVPYAKTNKELTEDVNTLNALNTTSVTEKGIKANFVKVGNVKTIELYSGSLSENVAADGVILTIPVDFRPKGHFSFLTTNIPTSKTDRVVIVLQTDGRLQVSGNSLSSGDALRGSATYI